MAALGVTDDCSNDLKKNTVRAKIKGVHKLQTNIEHSEIETQFMHFESHKKEERKRKEIR